MSVSRRDNSARALIVWSTAVIVFFNPLVTRFVFRLANGWTIFPAFIEGYLTLLIALAILFLRSGSTRALILLLALGSALLPSAFLVELWIYREHTLAESPSAGETPSIVIDKVHEPDPELGWVTIPNS